MHIINFLLAHQDTVNWVMGYVMDACIVLAVFAFVFVFYAALTMSNPYLPPPMPPRVKPRLRAGWPRDAWQAERV